MKDKWNCVPETVKNKNSSQTPLSPSFSCKGSADTDFDANQLNVMISFDLDLRITISAPTYKEMIKTSKSTLDASEVQFKRYKMISVFIIPWPYRALYLTTLSAIPCLLEDLCSYYLDVTFWRLYCVANRFYWIHMLSNYSNDKDRTPHVLEDIFPIIN